MKIQCSHGNILRQFPCIAAELWKTCKMTRRSSLYPVTVRDVAKNFKGLAPRVVQNNAFSRGRDRLCRCNETVNSETEG